MAYSEKEKEKVFTDILKRISEGEPLRKVLKGKGMPSSQTFYRWIDNDEEENQEENKSKRYARACEERADKIFEDILDIADDGTNDMMTIDKGHNSVQVEDREVTGRSKLRIEARKWMLAKMSPKKYGDKSEITLEGGDKPIQIDFTD